MDSGPIHARVKVRAIRLRVRVRVRARVRVRVRVRVRARARVKVRARVRVRVRVRVGLHRWHTRREHVCAWLPHHLLQRTRAETRGPDASAERGERDRSAVSSHDQCSSVLLFRLALPSSCSPVGRAPCWRTLLLVKGPPASPRYSPHVTRDTCAAATTPAFNFAANLRSFLTSVPKLCRRRPRPQQHQAT